jgi:hypothetical protein
MLLKDRPIGFLLPEESSSEDPSLIACGCRCGRHVDSFKEHQECRDVNHEGSRILVDEHCYDRNSFVDGKVICCFCSLLATSMHSTEEKTPDMNNEYVSAEDDIVYHTSGGCDDAKKKDRTIIDISTEYFNKDETAAYLATCERSYEKHVEIKAYQKELLKYKEERPKPIFEPEIIITEEQLKVQLQNIALYHLDDLNEELWKALSTRIVVAYYLQSEKNVFEKVLALHFYYRLK